MLLDRSRRHLQRYRQIARILARHGWGWMVSRLGFAEHLRRYRDLGPKEEAPAHVRMVLEELGPTFVKLGQILSTRPDVVPEAYQLELSKLQDTAPTVPFSDIRDVIESEFGTSLANLYQTFNHEPLAAASLAQVHRATLFDGTSVIVKVQRPHIEELIETDIEILFKRARSVEQHWEKAKTIGLLDVVDEFAMTLREELDYTREGRNTDRLRDNLSDERCVDVPLVYWHLTTRRVLTLQEITGTKITDVAANPPEGVDLKVLADRLAKAFLEQVFVDGFFHADPHPGNILVTSDSKIALLDAGQVGRLDSENRAGAIRMLMAFEQQDARVLADEVMNLGISQEDVDVRRLTTDLGKVLRSYYDAPSRSVNMGRVLGRVLNVSAKHKVRLPASFAVLGKVFTDIEGICRRLDPDFNFTEVARGYVGKAVRSELRSQDMLTELYRSMVASRDFLLNLPEHLDRLIRKAVDGTLRVEFKHQGLEQVSETFRASANKISIALIVAGAIVGSSLVVTAGRGPIRWFGLPALGVLGYIVATFFGTWLIVSIIRSGKHR
ncbi:MAG: AarF/ABC1/UbiB kinase family protein [Armatimonadota bacterium]|nr:AarF/ABC1/UbiB kinase family protein [bacterium]